MNHVLICPKSESIDIQMIDFNVDSDKALISINDLLRKVAKFMVLNGWGDTAIFAFLTNYPFKKFIATQIRNKNLNEPICFIIYARMYESYGDYIVKYLRKEYPGSVVVIYFGDLVSRHKLDIEKCGLIFDQLYSFDIADAQAHDMVWCRFPYSNKIISEMTYDEDSNKWDVTFVGTAKNRLAKILSIYETLTREGYKCNFHIIGVKKADRKYTDKIGYKKLSYRDLLQQVCNSRSILEVLQDGGKYPTSRYAESVLFHKILLTDCSYFSDSNTRTENVYYFDDAQDLKGIDLNGMTSASWLDVDKMVNVLSVQSMIDTIDGALVYDDIK